MLFHIILTLQVQWSPHNETILASSGTDRQLHVWDLRYVYIHKELVRIVVATKILMKCFI